jgi:hypothetical protein
MLGFILCSHGTESPVEFLQLRKEKLQGNLLGRFGVLRLDFPCRKRITGSIVLMYSSCKAKIRFELSETASSKIAV